MTDRFVDWIKSELAQRQWSIRKLAGHSPVTHAYIAKVLRGDMPVTWNFCAAMADAFDQPVWKFFLLAGLVDDVPNEVLQDEKIRVLIKSFNQLSEKDKDEVLNYIRWVKLKDNDSV